MRCRVSEVGRVRDREGNIQNSRQRLRQQRLAGACRADQQDVGLGQFDVVVLALVVNALVVVVHGHRQDLLRGLLADNIIVQDFVDVLRVGNFAGRVEEFFFFNFLSDDVVAQLDAFIADVNVWTGNQFFDFTLPFAAEAAMQSGVFACHRYLLVRTCYQL